MSGGFSSPAMREEFWARFLAAVDGCGFGARQQRGNFCYLWLPRTRAARIVAVADTRDHGLACKLDLLKGRSTSSVDPAALMRDLRHQRQLIEGELGLGRPRLGRAVVDTDLPDPRRAARGSPDLGRRDRLAHAGSCQVPGRLRAEDPRNREDAETKHCAADDNRADADPHSDR